MDTAIDRQESPDSAADGDGAAQDHDANGDALSSEAPPLDCPSYAASFCAKFEVCAKERGLTDLFAYRFASKEVCQAGIEELCKTGYDVFVPRAIPGGPRMADNVYACRAARLASCDAVLELTDPPASCYLKPFCLMDDGALGYEAPVACFTKCRPFPPLPEATACAVCRDYGLDCVTDHDGADTTTVRCQKVERRGAGAPCRRDSNRQCLPGFFCDALGGACQPFLETGGDCTGNSFLCNDRLRLTCVPSETGGKSTCALPPRFVKFGEACVVPDGQTTFVDQCGEFAFCQDARCVPRKGRLAPCQYVSDPNPGPQCLAGLSCKDSRYCDFQFVRCE